MTETHRAVHTGSAQVYHPNKVCQIHGPSGLTRTQQCTCVKFTQQSGDEYRYQIDVLWYIGEFNKLQVI